ncbi:MAG TPA: DUF3943 domain-containing protein [Polyangia bacterium]|nr:DUF3943 domain-containing protein [Polyangia bacterium]
MPPDLRTRLRRRSTVAVAVIVAVTAGRAPAARASEGAAAVLDDRADAAPAGRPPSYLRVALEELGFLAIQTAWYWGHDWSGDEKFNWSNWSTRLTSYHDMVLDDDRFKTGAVGHPIAGTGYYLIARGNGMGVGGSFVVAVMASTFWQFFSEWNEKPATNDLLVTPIAGWAIGEASYQLGQYFLDRGPGVVDCVGAALFSPVATFNDARVCRLGSTDAGRRGERRRWHRFDLAVGTERSTLESGVTLADLGADASLTTHRLYQAPGRGVSLARPGQWSNLSTDWLLAAGGHQGATFHADTIAVGNYRRQYDEPTDVGAPDGRGTLLALGTSFDYESRAIPVRWDRVMSVGILGPMIEVATARRPFELRARAAAYYGFAQVTSLAYPRLASSLSSQFIRSVLRNQGYYYAQALLPSAEVEGRYGQFRLTLAGRAGEYWSINGDDTHQSQITDGFSLRDARLLTAATLAVQPYCGPVRVALEFASRFWDSSLLGQTVTAREETVGASVLVGL